MRRLLLFPLAAVFISLGACSNDSDSGKAKIEHSLQVRFVDDRGNNLFDNQTYTNDAIRIVTYDNDGVEHDFFNGDWFAIHGYTVDRFYERYIFTIYFTLPEEGGLSTTETFMRFFGEEPDVFTTEYDLREGQNPDEAYGGGTVRVKSVKLNGSLIWDRESSPVQPVDIVKALPAGL
ncbi:MAG: hypothetical protein LIO77_10330 [Rikenellaceae bacterium]|nr:hypothetical protein [Rikenellaceae bacterium]